MGTFNEFNLNEKTLKAIEEIHFFETTTTQKLVLPHALNNENLACKGKTGSGKTHCFIIPIANKLNESMKKLQAIILVPTRELAIQTTQRCKEFFVHFDIKISCLTGGVDTLREKNKIISTPQILIGTPEKINEIAVKEGLLNLQDVKTLVIDEADMTLEMGFLNEVDRVAFLCKNAQIMVFSATIPAGIRQFIRKYFSSPLILQDDQTDYNYQIEHILYPLRGKEKEETLLEIVSNLNPYICLIFCNKKEEVESIYHFLINHSIDCGIIHGNLAARERKGNIKRALNGQYRFIVCSDIAARGIDIDGVSHVISLGFPKNNLEFYIHRAGRSGRLNMHGQCITIFDKDDKESIKKLEEQGIVFSVKEIKNGEWKELKNFDARNKRKNQKKTDDNLQKEINKVVRIKKSKTIKPNYKKKVKQAVEKVKRKHRREVIQKDIKKRIKERAIKRSKGEE